MIRLPSEYLHPMTNPTENEEINEELSTEELKSVSGGFIFQNGKGVLDSINQGGYPGGSGIIVTNGHGTGSGMTKADWKKRNRGGDSMAACDPRMGKY